MLLESAVEEYIAVILSEDLYEFFVTNVDGLGLENKNKSYAAETFLFLGK